MNIQQVVISLIKLVVTAFVMFFVVLYFIHWKSSRKNSKSATKNKDTQSQSADTQLSAAKKVIKRQFKKKKTVENTPEVEKKLKSAKVQGQNKPKGKQAFGEETTNQTKNSSNVNDVANLVKVDEIIEVSTRKRADDVKPIIQENFVQKQDNQQPDKQRKTAHAEQIIVKKENLDEKSELKLASDTNFNGSTENVQKEVSTKPKVESSTKEPVKKSKDKKQTVSIETSNNNVQDLFEEILSTNVIQSEAEFQTVTKGKKNSRNGTSAVGNQQAATQKLDQGNLVKSAADQLSAAVISNDKSEENNLTSKEDKLNESGERNANPVTRNRKKDIIVNSDTSIHSAGSIPVNAQTGSSHLEISSDKNRMQNDEKLSNDVKNRDDMKPADSAASVPSEISSSCDAVEGLKLGSGDDSNNTVPSKSSKKKKNKRTNIGDSTQVTDVSKATDVCCDEGPELNKQTGDNKVSNQGANQSEIPDNSALKEELVRLQIKYDKDLETVNKELLHKTTELESFRVESGRLMQEMSHEVSAVRESLCKEQALTKDLINQRDSLSLRLSDSSHHIVDLEKSNSELKRTVTVMDGVLKERAISTNKTHESTVQQLNTEVERLNQELTQTKAKASSAFSELERLKVTSQTTFNELKESRRSIEEKERRVNQLSQTISDLSHREAELKQQLEISKQRDALTKRNYSDMEMELSGLRAELATVKENSLKLVEPLRLRDEQQLFSVSQINKQQQTAAATYSTSDKIPEAAQPFQPTLTYYGSPFTPDSPSLGPSGGGSESSEGEGCLCESLVAAIVSQSTESEAEACLSSDDTLPPSPASTENLNGTEILTETGAATVAGTETELLSETEFKSNGNEALILQQTQGDAGNGNSDKLSVEDEELLRVHSSDSAVLTPNTGFECNIIPEAGSNGRSEGIISNGINGSIVHDLYRDDMQVNKGILIQQDKDFTAISNDTSNHNIYVSTAACDNVQEQKVRISPEQKKIECVTSSSEEVLTGFDSNLPVSNPPIEIRESPALLNSEGIAFGYSE